jgi:hypothetical protein
MCEIVIYAWGIEWEVCESWKGRKWVRLDVFKSYSAPLFGHGLLCK